MQVEIFNPADVYAAFGGDETCFLSGHERDGHCGFGLHFDDADALGAFGLAVVEDGRVVHLPTALQHIAVVTLAASLRTRQRGGNGLKSRSSMAGLRRRLLPTR